MKKYFIALIASSVLAAVLFTSLSHSEEHDWAQKQWLQCEEDFDCIKIYSGCYEKNAVNFKHHKKAKEKLYEMNGNPAEINCAMIESETPKVIVSETVCENKFCTIKGRNLCQDDACLKVDPTCHVAHTGYFPVTPDDKLYKTLSNPENHLTANIYGTDKVSCKDKCNLFWKRYLRDIESKWNPRKGTISALLCYFDKDEIIDRKETIW